MNPFPFSAYVRELPRAEIARDGLPFGYWCEFVRPFPVFSRIAGEFEIPAGFRSNGASIPKAVYALLDDTHPDILYPAYAHDRLYAIRGHLPGRDLTRHQCDDVIRELMLDIGAPRWKADAVKAALYFGGGSAWQISLLPAPRSLPL